MYAAIATRPDISFAVSALSQFLNNPGEVVTILSFALLYADTSDCLLSFIPHPLIGPLYFYDLIFLTRSHLAASCLVRYASGVAMPSPMYDIYLRATHTTTGSIGGVQIPIYLVSNTTDSL